MNQQKVGDCIALGFKPRNVEQILSLRQYKLKYMLNHNLASNKEYRIQVSA